MSMIYNNMTLIKKL